MKTINALTLILSATFVFQFNSLFAANDGVPARSNNDLNNIYALLSPTVPCEATFDDVVIMTDYSGLAPITPAEATFEDDAMLTDYSGLAPTTPFVATFDDGVDSSDTVL
jgi:hypothetical protein